ncbi:MAG: class I SAM-dependent methyltransferase [Thermomicrobiales bacterium]
MNNQDHPYEDNQKLETRDAQQTHWDQTYDDKPGMYGYVPSDAARAAIEIFAKEDVKQLLELGGGHGRDTFSFARHPFHVTVLDYSSVGIESIVDLSRQEGLSDRITALQHDVREPLPFADESFDACYSHMLFCMAISTAEQVALAQEVGRVLQPGGLMVYTVRHKGDAHFGAGVDHGDDRFETGGFEVHFFDLAQVDLLARGFDLVSIVSFEEGGLPRRLWSIALRKPR